MIIEPSVTLVVSNLVKEKKAKGETVFDLGVGEIIGIKNQRISDFVKTKLEETGTWQYPPIAGIKELREATAVWYNNEYQTSYSLENVLVTSGGKFALFILLQTLLKVGDEVLLPVPFWVSYPEIIKLFGAVPNFIHTKQADNWKISIEALEKAWTPKTTILILNNISNPVGVIYNKEELKNILIWAAIKKLTVISDEVYSDLVFDNKQKFFSCGAIKTDANVVVIQSCSKNFAMSGWRVGFMFSDPDIIKQAVVIQSQSTTGVAPICQFAALQAIKSKDSIQKNIKEEVKKRRDALIESLNENFNLNLVVPLSGLYLFISLKELGVESDDSIGFAQNLLNQSNVAVIPGKAFGAEGYIRLSFGGEEAEIKEGIKRLAFFVKAILK